MAYSYDDRDREFRQSPPPRPPRKEDNDLGSWILIIFLFIVAWPAGLAVLLSKVLGNDSRRKMPLEAPGRLCPAVTRPCPGQIPTRPRPVPGRLPPPGGRSPKPPSIPQKPPGT